MAGVWLGHTWMAWVVQPGHTTDTVGKPAAEALGDDVFATWAISQGICTTIIRMIVISYLIDTRHSLHTVKHFLKIPQLWGACECQFKDFTTRAYEVSHSDVGNTCGESAASSMGAILVR